MVNCGLLTYKNEPVALKRIEVDLQIQGHVATVTSTLQYVNEEAQPLEAVFVFPMPSGAALCQFIAKIADQEIVAVVKEKQEAREQYDDAICSGEEAFLLEESQASDDVFKLSVGSLPPGQSAAVTFVYITELTIEADHSLRFCLPAVLNPRYTPAVSGPGVGIVSEITSCSTGIPYSLSFTAHVNSPNPVTKVESKCTLEPLMFLNTDHTEAKVSLCAGHMFDRDVELYLYYQNPHQLTAIVEAGNPTEQSGTLMGDPAVMITFYPEFPESVMSSLSSCGEFVFLMDRSGSMSCNTHNGSGTQERIKCARDTLLLLLKSLPMDCYFNIYGFGSHYESFFPASVQYTQRTMEEAVRKVKVICADMGGTEILQPLQHIYKQACIPNHPRQLFIFTDGEVSNTKDVLQCVRSNAKFHRCFSFGIGEGASSALIKGLAENSSGHAQFITGTERMQAKVMQSLQYALQPAVIDITEDWTGVSFTRLSPPIKTLFHGQRALIYGQLKKQKSQKPDAEGKLSVRYRLGDQEVLNTVHFSLKPAENSRLTIHRLGARSLIRSLERDEQDASADKEALKTRVVELSKQSSVISSHTAFIAVHKGSREVVKGPMVTRRIPTMGFLQFQSRALAQYQMAQSGFQRLPQINSALAQCQMAQLQSGFQNLCAGPPVCGSSSRYDTNTTEYGALPLRRSNAACEIQTVLTVQSWSLESKDITKHRVPLSDIETRAKKSRKLGNSTSMKSCFQSSKKADKSSEVPADPLLQLITLQKASGCWEMESNLAEVFGKTEKELMKQIPAQVKSDVWATILALIWLHGFKIDVKIEWKILAMKAVSWVQSQKVVNQSECVQAGNALLGCQVKEDALGL